MKTALESLAQLDNRFLTYYINPLGWNMRKFSFNKQIGSTFDDSPDSSHMGYTWPFIDVFPANNGDFYLCFDKKDSVTRNRSNKGVVETNCVMKLD